MRAVVERLGPWPAVVALLLVHAGLLAHAATEHSPTMLEPAALVAGISHWQFGRFELYRVNPPLVRMVAALPVLAVGCKADWSAFYEAAGARPEFAIGSDFIKANAERSIWLFTIARWACIPFSLIGGVFCFLWARELWGGNGAGLIALVLWCFEPNVLAHGELITTDCAAASLGLAAGYFFWRWLKVPSWSRALAAGLFLGLAELAKMTWLILFGLWPVLWLFWMWRTGRLTRTEAQEEADESRESGVRSPVRAKDEKLKSPRVEESSQGSLWRLPVFSWIPIRKAWRTFSVIMNQPRKRHTRTRAIASFSQLTFIVLLAVYSINVAYSFDGTFTKLKDFTFVSRTLTGLAKPGNAGNRFAKVQLGELPVPLPKQYVLGLDTQKAEFERPHRNYLHGQWKQGGWWYYYLYGLWVKVPHGTQLVFALASILVFASRPRYRGVVLVDTLKARPSTSSPSGLSICDYRLSHPRDLVVLLAPALAVLILVSMRTNLNEHFRYALPCFGFAFILAGAAFFLLQSRRLGMRLIAPLCLLWTAGATLANHPHNLAYFNDLAGGPQRGNKHLVGSSLDWGQNLLSVRKYLRETPSPVRLMLYHGAFDPAFLGFTFFPRSLERNVALQGPEQEIPSSNSRTGVCIVSGADLIGDHSPVYCGASRRVILGRRFQTVLEGLTPIRSLGGGVWVFQWWPHSCDKPVSPGRQCTARQRDRPNNESVKMHTHVHKFR